VACCVEDTLHVDEDGDFIEEEANDAEATATDSVETGHAAYLFEDVGAVHAQHKPEGQSEV
jgi:hypothetical protein